MLKESKFSKKCAITEDCMQEMTQTERQIFILMLLSENKRGYTINDIHKSLQKWNVEVDKKTIGRDIDSLSSIYFISEEERDGKTYYTADKFRLHDITFTSPELVSLAFMLELLKPYRHMIMGRQAEELIHKLLDNTTNLNKEFIKHFAGMITVNTNDYIKDVVNPEIEEKLHAAIRNKNKVRILYHSFGSDEDTVRIIHPYELLINDGALNVVAFCELRNDIRDFRVSRIKELVLLDAGFEINEDYFHNKRRTKFIHMSGSDIEEVILAFEGKTARYIQEYEAELADEIKPNENGIIFIRKTAITEELIRWIMQFGPNVRVLNPPRLRERILQEFKKALAVYSYHSQSY